MRLEPGKLFAVGLAGAVALWPSSASAFVLAEDELEETSTELGAVVRTFGFVMAGPTLDPPFNLEDASPASTTVVDIRPYFSYRTPDLKLTLHQSLISITRSHASLALSPLGRGTSPPRFLPLRWTARDDPTATLATETEWAYAAWLAGSVTISVGRQPVSLGRGRIWRPWDVVSSFSLTEVDTEYKPGVDAARFDFSPSSSTTLSVIAAAGERQRDDDFQADLAGSAFVGRFVHGFGRTELGVLVGLVRQDAVLGWSAQWDLDVFDLYAEVSATWLREESAVSPAVSERKTAVPRALLGATIAPGEHWKLVPEVYYDGFGARHPKDYLAIALSERVALGEQVVLGNLYSGAALEFEAHPLVHLTALGITNLLDPSALASLSCRYDLGKNTRLIAGGYVPLGPRPDENTVFVPKSEFGLFPYFGFVELGVVM
ncbi:MAG: hypothetical protein IPI67_15810 [Myxococcales bacterium]|nr:hypothetical protein [Myxococcales bacterium]